MRARPFPMLFVLLAWSAALPVAPALATWSTTGDIVAGGALDEQTGFAFTSVGTAIAPAPDGGAFVAYVFGDSIRVNRLNGDTGARMWGTNGVKVNEGGNANSPPFVVSDEVGGCWVVWDDTRAARGIYVQRFDANGNPLGPIGGFLAAGVSGSSQPFGPAIAASPGDRILIAYWRTAAGGGLRVQRIRMQGGGFAPVIEFPGESLMTTDTGSPSDTPIHVFADGTGGGIAVWASNRGSLPGGAGTVKIVANRFGASGAALWGAEGAVVQAATGTSTARHRAAWDGTFLYACWEHISDPVAGTLAGIRAQKLDGNGVAQWGTTATGATVMNSVVTSFSNNALVKQPRLALDGAGNAWVAWVDSRDFNRPGPNGFPHAQDLYVQRMSASGAAQLAANGSPVDTVTGSSIELQAAPGNAGELLLVYRSLINEVEGDILIRRVTTAGSGAPPSFLSPFNDGQIQRNPVIAADDFAGVFVAWDDDRANPNQDVYATHRTGALGREGPALTLTSPNGGESLIGMRPAPVTWTGTLPALQNVKLEFKNGTGPRQTISTATPNDGLFTWTVPNLTSTQLRAFVSDASDGVPEDSSNAVFRACASLNALDPYGSIDAPNDVGLADFNEDGILDLAVPATAGVHVMRGGGFGGVGNGGFGPMTVIAVGSSARDVGFGDFNGDGILDIAATVSAGVAELIGDGAGGVGNGTFGLKATFPAGANPRGVQVADFNEDGILDLAVVNGGSNTISVLIGSGSGGKGDGSFAAAVNYAVGSNPSRAAVADFDEDGIWDLAVTDNSSNTVSVLLGNGAGGRGDGTFGTAVAFATGTGPIGIAGGDFNEDGITDLATAGSGGVSVLFGNGAGGVGNGTFAAPVTYPVGSATRDVVVADLDVDGRADLAAAASGTDGIAVLFGNGSGTTGDGTFTVGGQAVAGDFPTQLVLGDLLEDNVVDGVVANGVGDDVWTLQGDCAGALSGAITVTVPNTALFWQVGTNQSITWTKGDAVIAVDVEVSYDGGVNWKTIAENLTGTSFSWTVTGPQSTTCRVRVSDSNLQNRNDRSNVNFTISNTAVLVTAPNGGESFRAFETTTIRWGSSVVGNVKLEFSAGGGPRQLIASTTPNDGFEPWVVPNVGTTQGRLYVTGLVGGSPQDSSDAFFSICQRLTAVADYGTASAARGVVADDFNDDGITDLAMAGLQATVLLGQGGAGVGNGSFGAPASFSIAAGGEDIATGDFNDDGITDLAVADGAAVSILLGNGAAGIGDGTFGPHTQFPVPGTPSGLVIADFNEDGIEDFAGTLEAQDRVAVCLGNGSNGTGDGTFGAPTLLPVGDAPNDLGVADFNGDGVWDIATANAGSNDVSVLLGVGTGGVGNGTFAAAVNYPVGGVARKILAGPFGDEPTAVDLAVATDAGLKVLRSSFDGTFTDGPLSTGVGSPVAVVDLNFDPFPDLVGCGSNALLLSVNDSFAGFGSAGSIALTAAPQYLAVGDFEEDGAHDIAAVVTDQAKISVTLGRLCGGTPGLVSLLPPGPGPAVKPAGGDQALAAAVTAWTVGSNHLIQWTKSANVFAVNLEASRDGGSVWETIARNVSGTSYDWTVTPPATPGLLLRVSDVVQPGNNDVTDTPIRIDPSSVDAPLEKPAVAAFSRGRPNPARGSIAFELALPEESEVSVEAFDLNGRRVATLAKGRLHAGYHPVRWGAQGAGAPAGVYFVRARWKGFQAVRHVVLMP